MSTKTIYEWVWEECDEFDDVLDLDHRDSLAEAPKHEMRMGTGLAGYDLCLQKNIYDTETDDCITKAYAYVDPLTHELEDEFTEGGTRNAGRVPKRFHEELRRWLA